MIAMEKSMSNLDRGAGVIRAMARSLPETPGVYRMLGKKGEVLYVGKARSLRRRVTNYTQLDRQPLRLKRMISETMTMEVIHTHTEVEALLLEANMIKKLMPRFNILLRDDKSFPYILITDDHPYPRIVKHRGAQGLNGEYFGPFASGGAVSRTLETLQRAFLIRNCTDSYFAARTRPCLQYHIKRCTAPCTDMVTKQEYAAQVDEARYFLRGKSREVVARYAKQMEQASEAMEFERAAALRDRIRALSHILLDQDVNVTDIDDADVIVLRQNRGMSCVQVFFFRGGQNYGNQAFYPRHDAEETPADVLAAFLIQFYQDKVPADTVLLNLEVSEKALIAEALQERHGLRRLPALAVPRRGSRSRLIEFAEKNADAALSRHMAERAGDGKALGMIAQLFGMDAPPRRIEVYDNSHTGGTNMVAGMIVAGPEGLRKNAYRKFNIKAAAASDDFGMMREVMERRFKRLSGDEAEEWPDLLLIDGGQGQLSSVMGILRELGVDGRVHVVAISKGPDRNAGREWFHREGHEPLQLPVNDATLMYMQRLRDEAHRFAIGTMRARRAKAMVSSSLDELPGIGPARKKALLAHFGSGKAVERAGLSDLEKVEGISHAFAKRIYDYFHQS